ncbi:SCP2 sterol-binding domain-containing protein [Planctomycetota bacterium]|nr:SCP2 sterol-binding domain-containing protein [Planctomycetota bacterium]
MSEELKQAFDKMKARYKTGQISETMTIYFSLGDAPGQKWNATLTPDSCEFAEGKSDAELVIKTSEELFLKLIRGEWVPGMMDFMSGKIKSNDPTKLTVLKDCFV